MSALFATDKPEDYKLGKTPSLAAPPAPSARVNPATSIRSDEAEASALTERLNRRVNKSVGPINPRSGAIARGPYKGKTPEYAAERILEQENPTVTPGRGPGGGLTSGGLGGATGNESGAFTGTPDAWRKFFGPKKSAEQQPVQSRLLSGAESDKVFGDKTAATAAMAAANPAMDRSRFPSGTTSSDLTIGPGVNRIVGRRGTGTATFGGESRSIAPRIADENGDQTAKFAGARLRVHPTTISQTAKTAATAATRPTQGAAGFRKGVSTQAPAKPRPSIVPFPGMGEDRRNVA